jgi:hypothetical protein
VKLNPACIALCFCLLPAIQNIQAQDQNQQPRAEEQQSPEPQPPTVTQSSPTVPPPKFVPSEVNTGRGWSIEPMYWYNSVQPALRTGEKFASAPRSGDLDYSNLRPTTYGVLVSIPAAKTSMVRVSYFRMRKENDSTILNQDSNFFKIDADAGDPVLLQYAFSNLKASFDYLTYFWNVGKSELRLKTLWEIQWAGVTSDMTILSVDPSSGLATPKPTGHDFVIILPTVGIGLEHTLGRHFRWEAKGSGMSFGGRHSAIVDTEASVALRMGRLELLAGGKMYYYRSSPNDDNYIKGTMFGPYAGIRYYFKKERPTGGTTAAPTR